jgi:transcription antitermination factor NusG
MSRNWYALYTRPRFEKKVADRLGNAGFEVWLPMQSVVRQWSDRKKKVDVPLFSSYVFIHAVPRDLYHAVQTDGVAKTVYFNGEPAVIRDEQIELIRKILIGPDAFDVSDRSYNRGDLVRVVQGPLKGSEGRWINWRGRKRVCLELEQLHQVLLVEVPAAYVEKIGSGT